MFEKYSVIRFKNGISYIHYLIKTLIILFVFYINFGTAFLEAARVMLKHEKRINYS